MRSLLEKLLDISLHENEQEYHRKYPCKVESEELGELQTSTGIRFGDELVPAPAIAMTAEEHEHEGTEGQDIIADNKVLKVKDASTRAKGFKTGPYVETKYAGQGTDGERYKIQ